jgi:hypothetical protein
VYALAVLVMYRFAIQEKLYEMIKSLLYQKGEFMVVVNTLLFFAMMATPIIIYEINLNRNPFEQVQVDNLNAACHLHETSTSLKGAMLYTSWVGFVGIGLFYGLFMLGNRES